MNSKLIFALVACAMALPAQTPPISILEVQGENFVSYFTDTYDASKWATLPGPVKLPPASVMGPTFKRDVNLVDLVSVNGEPIKGHLIMRDVLIESTARMTPGRVWLDSYVSTVMDNVATFLLEDGTFIGTIASTAATTNRRITIAPGINIEAGGMVTGGSGAFMGVRGQGGPSRASGIRGASITEDPAYRRANGGGKITLIFQLIPAFWPEVVGLASGPAVYHASDFSLVTAEEPAQAGEQLTMRATGLGEVQPKLDPGSPFPPYPEGALHVVVRPVGVTVNGAKARVVNQNGWPGTTGVYRVDFLVPNETTAGMAAVTLSSAWINSPEVKIPMS